MSTDRRTAQQSYAAAELESVAHDLATTGSGGRNAQLNRAALTMGHYVGAGAITAKQVEAKLLATALRAGLRESEALSTIASAAPAAPVDESSAGDKLLSKLAILRGRR